MLARVLTEIDLSDGDLEQHQDGLLERRRFTCQRDH
jgi:hypothetical protein